MALTTRRLHDVVPSQQAAVAGDDGVAGFERIKSIEGTEGHRSSKEAHVASCPDNHLAVCLCPFAALRPHLQHLQPKFKFGIKTVA